MIIAIASGKGGTGKTTLAVNLAALLARSGRGGEPVRLLDCDVEGPNAHLFLRPQFARAQAVTVPRPVWQEDRCTGCGECAAACPYNALAVVKGRLMLFPELCHACGVCTFVCPQGALVEEPVPIGRAETAEDAGGLSFVRGVLNVGEVLAPKVVRAVKEHVLARGTTIIDAAPGTGCVVVAAINGADVAILVTEPTPFGLNDLRLAVELARKLRVPVGIVVNQSHGPDDLIGDYAEQFGLPVIGRIPFSRSYAETCSRGELLIGRHPEVEPVLLDIFDRARRLAEGPAPPAEESAAEAVPDAVPPPPPVPPAQCREVTVISGKGGTGKTTVVASLAALLDGMVLADCDVDAADLHLLLRPEVQETEPFVGGRMATIRADKCTGCGRCAEACHFGAIVPEGQDAGDGERTFRVNELACEGCGLCSLVCPADAVELRRVVTGRSFASETPHGPLSHAELGIAQESSGKLVARVRERARAIAGKAAPRILADGPPGTGCPAIASITGADLALIVTEPTVSAVHDLERALQLTRYFGVPSVICINKCDLNAQQADRIRAVAEREDAVVVGEVPFDEEAHEVLMAGGILAVQGQGPAAHALRRLAGALGRRAGEDTPRSTR